MQIPRKLGLLQIADRNWAVRRLRERKSSRRITPRPVSARWRGIPARPAWSEASTNFGGNPVNRDLGDYFRVADQPSNNKNELNQSDSGQFVS